MSGVSAASRRVWLPDSVLAAGAKLKEALAGPGGANIDHLHRKHPGLKFTVKGHPSTDLAPWRRLHVVVQGTDQKRLAKAEADLVDLCETACDVGADVLGLTDEQVQDAFDSIRVERQDTDARTVAAPTPMAAFTPDPFAAAPIPLGLNSIFQANFSALLRPTPTLQQTSKAYVAGATPKSTPLQRIIASPAVLPPGMGILPPGMPPHMAPLPAVPPMPQPMLPAARPPVPTLQSVPSPDAHAEVARLAQAWVNKGSRSAETPAGGQAKRRKKAKAKVTEDPYMSAGSTAAVVDDPYMAAVVEDPYMVAAAQEVQPSAAERQPEAPAPTNSPVVSAADTSKAPAAGATAAVAKAEGSTIQPSDAARMPPPAAVPAQKKKSIQASSETAQSPDVVEPGQQASQENEGAASDGGDSDSGSSDSESESDSEDEGEEEEDEDDDEEIGAPVEPEVDDSDERGKSRLQLYKLGARCCGVVAHFVGGNESAPPMSKRLDIDQRVRLDHCRKHLQVAGDSATVWHLGAADPNEKAAWTALCTYFVSRKRVGLAELEGGAVYIVPPDEAFLSELGLPAAAGSLAGSLLGLQVPHLEAQQESQEGGQKEEAAPQQTGEQK